MKGLKSILLVASILIIASFVVIGCGAPQPSEVIELKYGSINPANHHYSTADMAWIEKIQKDTNGRVKITPYWGATLVSSREATDELIKGVADIGYCAPAYSKLPFDLHKGTLAMCYGVPDYKDRREIYKAVTAKFPQIEGEFAGLKLLATSVGSTYQLISTKPVRTLNDFKGMKIKATGVYAAIVKELGGEGVNIPMAETYVALQKGTIDAALAPYDTLAAFKFAEVAKYVTVLDMTSFVYPTRGMNINSYNKLPPDIQKIFDKSMPFYNDQDDIGRKKADQEGLDFGKQMKVEFINLSKADMTKLIEIQDKVLAAEAKKLDDKGLPGTAIFKEIRAQAAKYIK